MASVGRNPTDSPERDPADSGGLTRPTSELLPQSRVERDLNLTKALKGNRGVIGTTQLHQLGFDDDAIAGLVGHGELRRLHRGVYADGRRASENASWSRKAVTRGSRKTRRRRVEVPPVSGGVGY